MDGRYLNKNRGFMDGTKSDLNAVVAAVSIYRWNVHRSAKYSVVVTKFEVMVTTIIDTWRKQFYG